MKIYTGSDRAKELKFKNFREMMFALAARNNQIWNGKTNEDSLLALQAHINAGRWAVICECGTGGYADPDYPYNYCSTCGNAILNGDLRLVIFPDNRAEIESALLEREIVSPFDIGTQTILMPTAKPEFETMHRSWIPGETIKQLREEYENARAPKGEESPLLSASLRSKKGGK